MATLRKKRVRFSMDVNLTSEAEKKAFCERLSSVRDHLTPGGSPAISNYELLLSKFNLVDSAPSGPSSSQQADKCPSRGCFLRNSG